ncbi:hypothetical protein PV416_46855 [Streptomyces ipomoeae]|uniref:hypothetical protein n=1 Tax=Streptomyces ipomoeae TaxID=103232 RepID=UPI0011476759|nr:hypothetical protein [Streptomyces ipomoeae]MDX2828373.1 hypothetical protein [Streptomyces ipomoeae]MDX2881340.1 hypothetical protein [Streptomyces ipomoeae]TQE35548.1 hypothetical protein Sipo7851_14195 [Streptomyces ipomoeae]
MSATTPGNTSDGTSHGTSEERRPVRALLRRWPTVLGLALTVPGLVLGTAGELADTVDGYGEFLPLLPLLYVVIHQAGRSGVTWPVLVAGVVFAFALQLWDVVSPAGVMVAVSLAVLLWGAFRGTPHGRTVFGIQAASAMVFCALAVTGLLVDPDLGRYVVAAGWFCHGVWDFAHLRIRRLKGIVAPAFAEWCAVVDVVVAVELLFFV